MVRFGSIHSLSARPTPPMSNTRPSGARTVACEVRGERSVGPAEKLRVFGSKIVVVSRVLAEGSGLKTTVVPPATSTRPSASNVAVASTRTPPVIGMPVAIPTPGS